MISERDNEIVRHLRREYDALKQLRRGHEPFWRDVKRYFCPERGRFLSGSNSSEVNNGGTDERYRLNGEGSRALSILASGIQSGLTSKSRQWFQLDNPDPVLGKNHEVRKWYGNVQSILENIFRRSNLYDALLDAYTELAAFGQACVSVEEHESKVINVRSHTCGTYYFATNEHNEVDTVFLIEYLTPHQLVGRFGEDAVGERISTASKNNRSDQQYEVIQCVTRHPERYKLHGLSGKPVASVHFLGNNSSSGGGGDVGILRISGFDTFPFMTPRWATIDNDIYGYAPTRNVLCDAKMLTAMETDKLKGLGKIVSPPMRIPPSMDRRGLNMERGGLNVVSDMGSDAVAPLYTVGIEIQQLQMAINQTIQAIKDGLYNGLFLALLMQDNPQMTATEVSARQSEKMLMLGPVLERIHYELLDPLIVRTFSLADARGLIPSPPDALIGQETNMEYVSILSQAQKAVGVSRIEQSMQFLGGLLQISPEIRHAIDFHKAFRVYNQMIGVSEDIMTSDEEYAKAVKEERQAAQQAQAAQTMQPLAESAKALSEIDQANINTMLSGGGLSSVL